MTTRWKRRGEIICAHILRRHELPSESRWYLHLYGEAPIRKEELNSCGLAMATAASSFAVMPILVRACDELSCSRWHPTVRAG